MPITLSRVLTPTNGYPATRSSDIRSYGGASSYHGAFVNARFVLLAQTR
jgi:hypothetical protein